VQWISLLPFKPQHRISVKLCVKCKVGTLLNTDRMNCKVSLISVAYIIFTCSSVYSNVPQIAESSPASSKDNILKRLYPSVFTLRADVFVNPERKCCENSFRLLLRGGQGRQGMRYEQGIGGEEDDYYKIMGLERNCKDEEIRKAYRWLLTIRPWDIISLR
jgi:hypothetical protein